ncbi:MAG TPA: type VI secretion system baseplate subunit TssE [Steroidobacteraceae bacterium]|jgi:type VI secretion system protein ImpF
MPGPRTDRPEAFEDSILDRLLEDSAPASSATRSGGVHDGLRRDIEALLNTHQYSRTLPKELRELSSSLLDYGMPHFLGLAAASGSAREQFRADVEVLLRRFEPRLKHVVVRLLENSEDQERTLRFRIDALVLADPEPEAVSFDSVLEAAQRRFAVTSVEP